jgi:hypothetical protein
VNTHLAVLANECEQEGSLATKSTAGGVGGGGGENFSMYREMQDLFYDLTFFCRCMSDSFLSDEKGGGGGGQKGPASSILADASQPSADTSCAVGSEIVHGATTKQSISALQRHPRCSPPRKGSTSARAADRFHQEHEDEDDDDDGTDGGGTHASSPSSQSRRSSSTGGSYSYSSTNTHNDDDHDNSTDASSLHTNPSIYS